MQTSKRGLPSVSWCTPLAFLALVTCSGGDSGGPTQVLTTFTLAMTYDTLRIGAAARAVATARDQSGAPMRIPEPTWTSSNPAVATVSQAGYVVALGLGTARISANALGKTAEATVHVVPVPVAGVLLAPTTAVLEPDETLRFVATAIDAAGSALTDRRIAWLSSDTTVLHVTPDGVVTAVGPGLTSVSAISENAYASAVVRVSGPAGPVTRVTVNPEAASLAIGETRQLATTLEDAEGDLATNRVVIWTSSAPNVATVSSTGEVQAIALGSAVIEATSEGARATSAIQVFDPADAITVRVAEPLENELAGETLRVVAFVTARNPILRAKAKVFNRETELTFQILNPRGTRGWLGTLYLGDVHYGPYQVVITAFDDKGNQGIATVTFIRGTLEGNGGARIPTRNR